MTQEWPPEAGAELPGGVESAGVSASFLDITTITVDPAYLQAAARRAAGEGAPPSSRRASAAGVLVVLAAVGLLFMVAARQTLAGAPEASRARRALIDEAMRRTERSDVLQERAAELRAEADAARDERLRTSVAGRELAEGLGRLELSVGSVAVTGPGVEVTLRDAPDEPGQEDLAGDGVVRDRDIQEVVNALWAAGAEAISINGQRLSALTAIREAGEAVLVDYRPVTPPYVISAVGDPDVVEPAFVDSDTAAAFRTLGELYGVGFSVRRRELMALPAAGTRLRYATVAP
ncbi:MAG TPA: DUF881 domain-containing protein [Mycobacteriales bacterium]|nr:DUF881 domain-containing protein [Mycobacteriales bacterium]